MISKVWGEGKGTVWGEADALKGVSGATDDLSSGVPAVGDREAIAGSLTKKKPEDVEERCDPGVIL
jgi:hypothetical protein